MFRLYLDGNSLSGTIPTWLNSLTGMVNLYLGDNQLTGTIPDLSNLIHLTVLDLRENQLTGELPSWLNELTELRTLSLYGNQFTGPIIDLTGLTHISTLNLNDNQLTGTIPTWINQLTSMSVLNLSDNLLTGTIPDLSSLTQLARIDLTGNQLTGPVPAWLNNLTLLNQIVLGGNQLTGTIPLLSNLSLLNTLDLSENQIDGTLPSWLGELPSLRYLYLNSNQMTGSIEEVTFIFQLIHLRLDNNHFSGSIPPWVGNLTALRTLYLNDNELEGEIPQEIGNMTSLQNLYLNGNKFTGPIPETLSNLTSIYYSSGFNFNWNGLYTDNTTLRNWICSRHIGYYWENTQTVAPTDLSTEGTASGSVTVSWTPIAYTANSGGYYVYYSTSSGSGYQLAGTVNDKSLDSYTVTDLEPSTTYYFIVRSFTSPHAQNGNTVISDPSEEVPGTPGGDGSVLSITFPNGGEQLFQDFDFDITWTTDGSIDDVVISYSYDGGASWQPVSGGVIPNTGSFTWLLPATPSTECLVRIEDAMGTGSDESDAFFEIKTPVIELTSFNGGTQLFMGFENDITWTTMGLVDNVVISYSYDGGSSWQPVSGGVIPNTGTFTWLLPNSPSAQCLVRIEDAMGYASDVSDSFFEILAPVLTLTSFNGGSQLFMGATFDITWTTQGLVDSVVISYSYDGGSSWQSVSGGLIPNTGTFTWLLPNSPSAECLVRIEDAMGFASDVSDGFFEILAPVLTLTSFTGGEQLFMGNTFDITWTTQGIIEEGVVIHYSYDGGASWQPVSGGLIANTGSFTWLLPNSPSTQCLVRIEDALGFAMDQSDSFFTILPPVLNLTSFTGGEELFMGATFDITWTSIGNIEGVVIHYSYDGGASWQLVSGGVIANTGTFTWLLPNSPSSECLVRIEETMGFAMDQSDSFFTILAPSLTLTSPTGGENWQVGSSQDITWDTLGLVESVMIQYSYDGGSTWELVTPDVISNTGSYTWTVLNTPSEECLVRVEDVGAFAMAESQTFFTISPSAIPTSERDALIALYNSTGGDSWSNNSNWRKSGDPTQFNDPGTEHTWFGVISTLGHVEGISLGYNGLSGTIPAELNNLPYLTDINLEGNLLSGDIPVLSSLTSMREFNLADNQLTGVIPPETANMAALTHLQLNGNRLSGEIPVELGTLTGLVWLRLNGNQLAGSIPTTLMNLSALQADGLDIRYNGLSTEDSALRSFLNSRQVGGVWDATQTVAPAGVMAVSNTHNTVTLTWTPILYDGDPGVYKVYCSTVSGSGYTLKSTTTDKTGDIVTVTGLTPGTTYYFVVESVTYSHAYNQNIVTSSYSEEISVTTADPPTLSVVLPGGGENWEAGTVETITWTGTGFIENVSMDYSVDGGVNWEVAAASVPNTGSYDWTVPGIDSVNCLVRVSDTASSAADTSGIFSIFQQPSLTLTAPNGGEVWPAMSTQDITWTSTGSIANVKIEYSKDNGLKWTTIVESAANTGVYAWTIRKEPKVRTACLVRISDVAGSSSDVSDAVFTISR